MQINITARHLHLTGAIADYVRKRVERFGKFFDDIVWAQVILIVEKRRQLAEIVLHVGKHTFRAKDESTDLYAAIDLVTEKMEKQLRKLKEISKVHRKTQTVSRRAAPRVSDPYIIEGGSAAIAITETRRFDVKPVSVEQAVTEMEMMGYAFYMFLNDRTQQINLVYKRDNGTYGLIEPEV